MGPSPSETTRGLDPRLHGALPLQEGSWIADSGNDELMTQSYVAPSQKTMESSFGGINVDFHF
jgi:hypothetical protein